MENNEPSSRVQFLATLIRGDRKNVDSTPSFFSLHVDRVCSNIKSCREAVKRYNLVAQENDCNRSFNCSCNSSCNNVQHIAEESGQERYLNCFNNKRKKRKRWFSLFFNFSSWSMRGFPAIQKQRRFRYFKKIGKYSPSSVLSVRCLSDYRRLIEKRSLTAVIYKLGRIYSSSGFRGNILLQQQEFTKIRLIMGIT